MADRPRLFLLPRNNFGKALMQAFRLERRFSTGVAGHVFKIAFLFVFHRTPAVFSL
jgi:hypothetical protein